MDHTDGICIDGCIQRFQIILCFRRGVTAAVLSGQGSICQRIQGNKAKIADPVFLIFGDEFSFIEYSVQALIFGVIVGLSCFFDDKGWNSWKKIGNLFKRKRVDN